jgi:hypothetical protein
LYSIFNEESVLGFNEKLNNFQKKETGAYLPEIQMNQEAAPIL